jgi:sec-independent protein translocase protein TatC
MQQFITHFIELKKRIKFILIAFICAALLSYYFSEYLIDFLLTPLQKINNKTDNKIIFTNLSEMFIASVKLSLMTGFVIIWPIIVYQIYLFIAPALYKNEKKIILPLLIAVPALFLIGGMFSYYVIMPLAWKFFLGFEVVDKNITPIILEAKISEYLDLVSSILVAGGIIFQLPIIMIIMLLFEIVTVKWFREKRKIAIIIIFIAAAILTPPDVISQIALAIPMILLYELSILLGKLLKD